MIETIQIPTDLKLDVLIDGIDYSCRGFWGQIEEYKWEWWYQTAKLKPDTVLCRIRDDEDGQANIEGRPWVDITLEKLDAAIRWALVHYNHIFSWTVENGIVIDLDYDGIGADAVIQRIVLGQVVYG